MTDKKLTDEEIIKALEDYIKENEFEYFHSNIMGEYSLIRKSFDFIKRQKSEIDSAKAKIEICAEVIERQDKEIERLKTNLNVELNNFASEYDYNVKAESYKEFCEKRGIKYVEDDV